MTHQLTINETQAFIYIFGWRPNTQKQDDDYTPIFTEIMDIPEQDDDYIPIFIEIMDSPE